MHTLAITLASSAHACAWSQDMQAERDAVERRLEQERDKQRKSMEERLRQRRERRAHLGARLVGRRLLQLPVVPFLWIASHVKQAARGAAPIERHPH